MVQAVLTVRQYAALLHQIQPSKNEKGSHLFIHSKRKEYKVFDQPKDKAKIEKGFRALSLREITLLGANFREELQSLPALAKSVAHCLAEMANRKDQKGINCFRKLLERIINVFYMFGCRTNAQIARRVSVKLSNYVTTLEEKATTQKKKITPIVQKPQKPPPTPEKKGPLVKNILKREDVPIRERSVIQPSVQEEQSPSQTLVQPARDKTPPRRVIQSQSAPSSLKGSTFGGGPRVLPKTYQGERRDPAPPPKDIGPRSTSAYQLRQTAENLDFLMGTGPKPEDQDGVPKEGSAYLEKQKAAFSDFATEFKRDPNSRKAKLSICKLLNNEIDFAKKELPKEKITLSVNFLLGCLAGFDSEEIQSEFSLNPTGINGVLTLLNELPKKPLPTTAIIFNAFLAMMESPQFREFRTDMSQNIIQWVLDDKDNFKVHHLVKLVRIYINADLRETEQGHSQSTTLTMVYEAFRSHSTLGLQLIEDEGSADVCQYLLLWITQSASRGMRTESYLEEPFQEWQNAKDESELSHFFNLFLKKYLKSIGKELSELNVESMSAFKAKVSYYLVLHLVEQHKKKLQNQLSVSHLKTIRTVLNILEDIQHLGESLVEKVRTLLMDLLGMSQNASAFYRIMNHFAYCAKNKRLVEAYHQPILDSMIDYLRKNEALKSWVNDLSKNDEVRFYLANSFNNIIPKEPPGRSSSTQRGRTFSSPQVGRGAKK